MSRLLLLATLALTSAFPVHAQEPAPAAPQLAAIARTETTLRDALTALFEKQKVPYLIGPGIEGKLSFTVDIAALPLKEAVALLLAASDKPINVETRKNGVWILKLAPMAPTAPPQVNIAPAQVHVSNHLPKNPTIASLNVASNGDPVIAVLELQANLLEQEIASAKENMGPASDDMKMLYSQLRTVRGQLAVRRAQATKKTTAAATTKRR
ncbi:hypothetical protein [Armatimonas sp.]|uniref:hypothetical protein n=1 Tax=Armatimonas sp. TaxID=1872638 RepID=UPI00374CEF38